jgi:hypothetical protein
MLFSPLIMSLSEHTSYKIDLFENRFPVSVRKCSVLLFILFNSIVTCIRVTIDGAWIGIEVLQLIITSKDYALTVLRTSQVTVGHTKSSQSVTVFTSRCLVVASNVGLSPSSGFPNYPRPQLLASHNS